MAKLVEYDISDVEESGGGGSEEPKPAVYPAEIVVCERRTQKNDGTPIDDLRVGFNLGGNYRWLWKYIGFGETSEWKLAEFVRALDLKEKGKFDPDKLKGKMIRVKVNPGTYEGAYSAEVGRLMKALPGDELAEATVSDNGDQPAAAATEAEPEPVADGEFVPSREGEELGSYEDWSDDDLEGEVEDRGLTVPGGRGTKKDKWVKALRADDVEAAEAEADTTAEPTPDEEADDYDTWPVKDLEAEHNDRELTLPDKPRGRNAGERWKQALIESLRKDNAENPFEGD